MKRHCAICAYTSPGERGEIITVDAPSSDPLRVTTWCRCPACGCIWQNVFTIGIGSRNYVVHVGEVAR